MSNLYEHNKKSNNLFNAGGKQQSNEFMEDDFVLQSPDGANNQGDKTAVTTFVFECNMSDGESDKADNVGNTLPGNNTDEDNFTINKPESKDVSGFAVYTATNQLEVKQDEKPDQLELYVPSIVDITKSISKVSNMIRGLAKEKDVYAVVSDKKLEPQDFYTKLSNSIWKSLIQFCGIVQNDTPDSFDIPTITIDSPYLETWLFFDNIYHDTNVSFIKEPLKAISKYKKKFKVDGCISSDWIPMFVSKLQEKAEISENEAMQVAEIIKNDWCYTEHHEDQNVDALDQTEEAATKMVEELTAENKSATPVLFSEDMSNNQDNDEECDGDCDHCNDEECKNTSDDDEEDNDEEAPDVLSIDVQKDEGVNESIISINAWNGTIMMLYADLEHIDIKSVDTKDQWNWLKHFIPNALVLTEDPEMFIKFNHQLDEVKFIKLAKTSDVTDDPTDTSTVIGLYYLSDFVNTTSDEFIKKINVLVETNVAHAPNLSHLKRTLQMDTLIVDEAQIIACLNVQLDDCEEDDNDEDEDDGHKDCSEEHDKNTNELADYAAQIALAGANNNINTEEVAATDEINHQSDDKKDTNEHSPMIVESEGRTATDDNINEEVDQIEDDINSGKYHGHNNTKRTPHKRDDDEEMTFEPIRKGKNTKYQDM